MKFTTFTVYRRDTGLYICNIQAKDWADAERQLAQKLEKPHLYKLRMRM